LKKPNRVLIKQFMQRIQQLSGYLEIFPCLYYSNHMTKLTKAVKPFNDTDLASHILRMVPRLARPVQAYGSHDTAKCAESASKRPS
jgi:hypothetical protein